MMATEDPDKFKIRIDDEDPDVLQQEELKDKKFDKLNHRITILTILLPCLMILMLVAGYFEIKKRLASNMDASTTAVSNLYKEIDGQLDALSETILGVNGKMDADIENLEKALKDINKLKSHFSDFEVKTVDKEEQEKALGKISQQILPIQKQVDALKKDIKVQNDEINQNIAALNTTLNDSEKTIKNIQLALSRLDKNKIDSKTLQKTLKSEIEQLNAKNSKLQTDIDRLRIALIKVQKQALSGSTDGESSPGVIEQTIE